MLGCYLDVNCPKPTNGLILTPEGLTILRGVKSPGNFHPGDDYDYLKKVGL